MNRFFRPTAVEPSLDAEEHRSLLDLGFSDEEIGRLAMIVAFERGTEGLTEPRCDADGCQLTRGHIFGHWVPS